MQSEVDNILDTNRFREISGQLSNLVTSYNLFQVDLEDLSDENSGLVTVSRKSIDKLHQIEIELMDNASELASMVPKEAEQRRLTSLLCLDLEENKKSQHIGNLMGSLYNLGQILDSNNNPNFLEQIESNIQKAHNFTFQVLSDMKEYFKSKTNYASGFFLASFDTLNQIIASERTATKAMIETMPRRKTPLLSNILQKFRFFRIKLPWS